MQPVDRVGVFQAEIVESGLNEAESGSVGINLRCRLTAWWDASTQKWVDWIPYDMEADGCLWVVKKDGNPNERAAESLIRHAGWDGTFASIAGGTWQPHPIQVEIKEDEYKGNKRKRIEFVNDHNRTPGTLNNVDAAKAGVLDTRLGATFRALSANVGRNRVPVSSKPSPPPPAMAGASGDGAPF